MNNLVFQSALKKISNQRDYSWFVRDASGDSTLDAPELNRSQKLINVARG